MHSKSKGIESLPQNQEHKERNETEEGGTIEKERTFQLKALVPEQGTNNFQ